MSRLDPTPDELRKLGTEALELMIAHYAGLSGYRVSPDITSAAIREKIVEPLPPQPAAGEDLLATIREVLIPATRHNGHPRFFGYVASPGTAIAAIGDMLTAMLNANVTAWRSAPAATEVEHLVVDWIKQMLGYPAEAFGILTSGGSMANLSALATARTVQAGNRVYVGSNVHFSIYKAARLLGLHVVTVSTDALHRLDVDQLRLAIAADREAGLNPLAIVASAGATSTGAFDQLDLIAAIAEAYNLWLHVDAAYGGFAVLAQSARHLFAAIARADSVTLDPHKWLFLPAGCGCVLYKDPAHPQQAFHHDADYTRVIGLEQNEAFAFWDYGPELSRRFRGLSLWMLIKYVGAVELSEAVEMNLACAQHLAKLVEASEDFELLAPVGLSIFCFRYKPRGFAGNLNLLNERILVELARQGSSYLSNAMIHGQFALRGCVLSYRTTFEDMQILLGDVRRAALEIEHHTH